MKKVLSFLFVIVIISALTLPFSAAENGQLVVDGAKTMNDTQFTQLTEKLTKVSNEAGLDVVVVTIPTLESGTMMEYADDYYDYHGYAKDGILLLIATEDRNWYISTKGYGITAFTDYGIDYIGEALKPDLKNSEWYDAFDKFADLAADFVKEARSGKPYDTNHKIESMSDILFAVGVSAFIGIVIAVVIVLMVKSKYKPVKLKAEANDYLIDGSLELKQSYDHFLYTHVSRTAKPKDSGGGSSTHTSSSGSSHGGGGGSF